MYGNDENILSQHVMSKGFLQTYFWGDDNKRFNTTIKLSKNTAGIIFFIMSDMFDLTSVEMVVNQRDVNDLY